MRATAPLLLEGEVRFVDGGHGRFVASFVEEDPAEFCSGRGDAAGEDQSSVAEVVYGSLRRGRWRARCRVWVRSQAQPTAQTPKRRRNSSLSTVFS
jgi:hypothetical protein